MSASIRIAAVLLVGLLGLPSSAIAAPIVETRWVIDIVGTSTPSPEWNAPIHGRVTFAISKDGKVVGEGTSDESPLPTKLHNCAVKFSDNVGHRDLALSGQRDGDKVRLTESWAAVKGTVTMDCPNIGVSTSPVPIPAGKHDMVLTLREGEKAEATHMGPSGRPLWTVTYTLRTERSALAEAAKKCITDHASMLPGGVTKEMIKKAFDTLDKAEFLSEEQWKASHPKDSAMGGLAMKLAGADASSAEYRIDLRRSYWEKDDTTSKRNQERLVEETVHVIEMQNNEPERKGEHDLIDAINKACAAGG